MIYRPFGNTGTFVSAIGMGGMRFKKEDYEKAPYDKAVEIVHEAYKEGITYFDTAPGYCDDMSEIIYGEAFKTMKRNTFLVSSKCGLWNATTSDGARKMIDQSLKRMNLDYIDFYNVWSIKTIDEYHEYMKKGGVYEGILKAKEEGKVGHICCTTHLKGDDIEEVIKDDYFEAVTLGYNAINFAYRQKGLESCYNKGLGIVTMNPLSGGLIPQYPDHFSFLKQGDNSLVVSALKFILAQRKATVALVGFSSVSEVHEAVLATKDLTEVGDDYLQKMSSHLKGEMNALCTGCGYCDSCPSEINIPQLMDS
ncbi:MAG: aldo/keto reductase, partial [Spirochaetia bacterium]|nr:aldo/keto reductase [Spirochaetia bacterium]